MRAHTMGLIPPAFIALLALLVGCTRVATEHRSRDKERLERFEKKVDELRALLGIPGMSAVIVKDQRVLWARGFGFADASNALSGLYRRPTDILCSCSDFLLFHDDRRSKRLKNNAIFFGQTNERFALFCRCICVEHEPQP